jgi:hypothetical protein
MGIGHVIRQLTLAFLLWASLANETLAQTGYVRVFVHASNPDTIGTRLVSGIREQVRASRLMDLVDTEAQSTFQARIVTLNPDQQSTAQVRTIYSLVITRHLIGQDETVDDYLQNFVGVCGADRVRSCVEDLVAQLEDWITRTQGRVLQQVRDKLMREEGSRPRSPSGSSF